MILTDLFDLSFQGRRNDVALEFRGQQFTFGDIDARSNRMARLLERFEHESAVAEFLDFRPTLFFAVPPWPPSKFRAPSSL
jgi:hypothetical protein